MTNRTEETIVFHKLLEMEKKCGSDVSEAEFRVLFSRMLKQKRVTWTIEDGELKSLILVRVVDDVRLISVPGIHDSEGYIAICEYLTSTSRESFLKGFTELQERFPNARLLVFRRPLKGKHKFDCYSLERFKKLRFKIGV